MGEMEDNSAFIYTKEKSFVTLFLHFIFSQVGLFLLVWAYACAGAVIFIKIESPAENNRYLEKQEIATQVFQTIDYTTNLFWFYGDTSAFNWTFASYNKTVTNDLRRLEVFILEAQKNNYFDGTILNWQADWTFLNALLFTISIMTTIGYGNVVPKTYEGQMFCIVYSLIGCPLFLVFLAQLGDAMAKGFTFVYSRLCCRCFRSRRYLSEMPENHSTKRRKNVVDDIVGEEEYMPTSKMFVPITLNLVMLHGYFFFGAYLFELWEQWSFWDSFYFTFISLSTIGYGDFVPGKSAEDHENSILTRAKMVTALCYIFLGMALLSMCINLMQEQIVEKCRWVARETGLTSDETVDEPPPYDKRKDSLMPIMEQNDGPSPFRDTGLAVPSIPEHARSPSPIPGALDDD